MIEFQSILKPHQLKREPTGMSVLEQATTEHNILSLARVYKCISFDSLEQLLKIPSDDIEKIITRMISANLLKGTIDQIDRMVTFESKSVSE